MSEKPRLMLIDGHALAFRAYHAIPPLTSPSGEPTNATLGYASMLLKAIDDYQPDYVVATFDTGRTFRHEEFDEYKATRAETPDDLRSQFQRIVDLTETLGIPVHAVEGYEADDLLGTLSKQASGQGLETIIVTGDSDIYQLITNDVKVLISRRTFSDVVLYDLEGIRKRYGLEPLQLIDLKAITGDSSDNIPGVRGVGAKTATPLLQQYGSLEVLYEHLDEVTKTRFRNALAKGRDDAFLSKRLITIVQDVDVHLDLKASEWGSFDRAKVMDLLRELGFSSLANRIPGEKQGKTVQLGLFGQEERPSTVDGDAGYEVVDTVELLQDLVAELKDVPRLALDTETTGTEALKDALVGISLAAEAGKAYYVPVGHDPRLAKGEQVPLEALQRLLGPVLADAETTKVFHNSKFDMIMLSRHGLFVRGPCFDTLLAAWLLSPSGRGIGLKEQAWQRLGVEMTPISELIGTGRKQITMAQVGIAKVAPYAAADADMTLRLMDVLEPELREHGHWDLFAEMEIPLVPVLIDMELHGMAIDAEYLKTMSRDIAARLAEIESEVHGLVGHTFNINSTKQLGVVLFGELELKVIQRTRTGYSTSAAVLDQLKDEHPVIALVLEYRQLGKLKGTYIDSLPALINQETGRVHTSFNQTGTSTGRLSSRDPNLQNIPVRTELGRRVRGAFVAPAGHMLLGCDYSQVELRVLAHVSGDPELCGAFHRGEDVHATTAAAIFGVPLGEVSREQRNLAKSINFGLMYGMSGFGLATRTDLTVDRANAFIDTYFGRFRLVKEYLDQTIADAHRDGYVSTIMGRRRYFPELRSSGAVNSNVRRGAERAAVNMPIQGSASDIIKLAMISLHRRLHEERLQSAMVLQVHDELVLEVPEGELDTARDLVVETMENAYTLDVPLKVDASVGRSWMEMK